MSEEEGDAPASAPSGDAGETFARIVARNPFKTDEDKARALATDKARTAVADAFLAAQGDPTMAGFDELSRLLPEMQEKAAAGELDLVDEDFKVYWDQLQALAEKRRRADEVCKIEAGVAGAGESDLPAKTPGKAKRQRNADYAWVEANRSPCDRMAFDMAGWKALDRNKAEDRKLMMTKAKVARNELLEDEAFMRPAWEGVGLAPVPLSTSRKPTGDHCKSFMLRPSAAHLQSDAVFKVHLDVKAEAWVLSYTHCPRPKAEKLAGGPAAAFTPVTPAINGTVEALIGVADDGDDSANACGQATLVLSASDPSVLLLASPAADEDGAHSGAAAGLPQDDIEVDA